MQANTVVYTFIESDLYHYMESKQESPHRRKCIDGSVTGSGNCVGYCRFCEHPGYLTKELRKEHDCIKKGCHYYTAKSCGKTEQQVQCNPFAALLSMA